MWDEPVGYRVFAALVIPELVYALILQTAYIAAVVQKITGSTGTWVHVAPTETTTKGKDLAHVR